jgi:radical SAM superfamily enzyme YgiQ (UPF0313 family)
MVLSILLVNPPLSTYKYYLHSDFQEPLGILYLAGYLRQKGLNVDCVDFFSEKIHQVDNYYWQGDTVEQIEEELRRRNPKVVGISSMFSVHCEAVHRTAAAAKRVNPDMLVVVGGAHASAFPKVLAVDSNIDVVVVGEGERTLLDLLKKHWIGESYTDINGIAYFDESGDYHRNPDRNFLNFSEHPGPAHDILNINQYLDTDYSRWHGISGRRLPIVTSRGCPQRCVYCSIHSVWRYSYHRRNPESVINEIEWLVKDVGVREIMFWDDNLAADRRHFNAILDGIIERRLQFRWCTPNGIAIWRLNEELIYKCRAAGCYKLTFGIETGSPRTQRFIKKTQINLENANKIIKYCNKLGIWTRSPFLIGFPFETREDILMTIDYAIDCEIDVAVFWIAMPYPGCEMYEIYKEHDLLPDDVDDTRPDLWIGDLVTSKMDTCVLKHEEIHSLQKIAQRRFRAHRRKKFVNPFYMARKMRRWDEIKFVLKFIPTGFKQYLLNR